MTSRLSSTRIKLEECKSWRRVACTRLLPFPSSPPPLQFQSRYIIFRVDIDTFSIFFFSRSTKRISRIRGKSSLPSIHPSVHGFLCTGVQNASRFSREKRGWNLFFFSPSLPLPSKKRGSVRGVPPSWPGVRGSWLITNVFY